MSPRSSARDGDVIVLEGLGEDPAAAVLVEPVELRAAQQEDAAQHELGARARDGSRRRPAPASSPTSRRTPASARCRDARAAARCRRPDPRWCSSSRPACGVRPAAAALIEQHDAVARGIVIAAHRRVRAAARPAVQEHRRLAVRIAAFLEIDLVAAGDLEPPRPVRDDFREERQAYSGFDYRS